MCACFFVRVITYVLVVRIYFSEDIYFPSPLHTRLLLASAWKAHHPPILKKAKGVRQLRILLLDDLKLSELGIKNFCCHNTIRFGEMRNRIMQQCKLRYCSAFYSPLSVSCMSLTPSVTPSLVPSLIPSLIPSLCFSLSLCVSVRE